MTIKEYKLSKTANKTAKENNLIPASYGTNILLDISILANAIEPEYLGFVTECIRKQHIFHDTNTIFILRYDKFTAFEIRAAFVNHSVYNKETYKRRYLIAEMVAVKVTKMHRSSVYQASYDNITETIKKTDHSAPLNDIEI